MSDQSAADVIARAGDLVREGQAAEAVRLMEGLWSVNRGAPALLPFLSRARLADARDTYANGDLDGGAERLQSALADDSNHPGLLGHWGIVLMRLGRPEEAVNVFRDAMVAAADPGGEYGWLWNQAAALARQGGELTRARQLLDARTKLVPNDQEAAYGRAFVDLARGRMAEGWRGYTARWKLPGFPSPPKNTKRPAWDGRPLDGRLLVWREQGLGDEIMFARHLPAVSQLCDKLIVECDPRMVAVYRRAMPGIRFMGTGPGLVADVVADIEFDRHCPMGSLPALLSHDGSGYPSAGAYLRADPERVRRLRAELLATTGGNRLIGVSWWSKNAEHGITRSVSLDQLAPLARVDGHSLVSVQYGDHGSALSEFHTSHGVKIQTIHGIDTWNDLDGLSALVATTDMVVSIDNTTVHMAGALGVQVHLLLPRYHDWRWDMPTTGGPALYPGLTIHHQANPGRWHDVVSAVIDAVRAQQRGID